MDFELSGNKYSPSGLQLSLSAAGIALVLHVIYSLYLHPLASIPGPLFARLSYAWLYTVSLGGRRCLEVHELHKVRLLQSSDTV